MSGGRMRRVDEAVREVLSGAITQELKDPRVGFVTVTAVETSPDLRHARVFVSVLGDDPQRERSMDGLRSAHGFLQRRVADELTLKHTPTLDFLYDDSVDRSLRIQALLEEEGAVSGSNGALVGARADARRDRATRERFLLATHENPDGDALGSLAGMQLVLAGARQGRGRLHGAGRVPAALRVPLHPGREPRHRAARRPRGRARSSSSTAATSTATRPTRSSARARTSSTSTTTTTTRSSGPSTTSCPRRRARPR